MVVLSNVADISDRFSFLIDNMTNLIETLNGKSADEIVKAGA